MNELFISGQEGKLKSDCRIFYTSHEEGGRKIEVQSKVDVFYGKSIYELAEKTLAELAIDNCHLKIEDFGALPYVIQARIEAVIKTAHPEVKLESLPDIKHICNDKFSKDSRRITRLYVPGNQPKLMVNAGLYKPDGVILDLEDAVAPDEKLSARLIVRNALRTINFYGAEKMVRINQGVLGFEDLEAVVPNNVNLILVPKVETPEQLVSVNNKIKEISAKCGRTEPVYLMPIIESARGVLNALRIAECCDTVAALAIGLEDYTADLGTQISRDGAESLFARSMVVNAAKAAGIGASDSVFSDVGDDDGLLFSAKEARKLGFDGKGCIHPGQIRIVEQAFAPSQEEIERAQKIVQAFEDAKAKGLGVISLGSKMIDPPVVKKAIAVIKATGKI
ncbi:MAG: aldolase/citrate lyase family protein [Lentisphaerota bacterium]